MIDIVFCHLLNDFSGSPKVLSQVIQALGKSGGNAKLYLGSSGDGFLSSSGIPIARYWYVRSAYRIVTLFTYFFSQLCLFLALCLDRDIDKNAVIYVNTLLPFGAALYGAITGRKVICHVHEISISPAPLRWFLIGVVRCTSSLNIYVSYAHMQVLPISGVPARCIHNALDDAFRHRAAASTYAHRRDGMFQVLMIASLRDYKGVPELLELARALAQQPDIAFELVVNDDQTTINSYFSQKSSPANLTVHPRTHDTPAFYARASLVLNLSRPDLWQETFGLTVLEALAFGVPVIVPPLGGPAELVSHGVHGFLIDSRDGARLASAVMRLVRERQLCEQISEACRERAADFSASRFSVELARAVEDVRRL